MDVEPASDARLAGTNLTSAPRAVVRDAGVLLVFAGVANVASFGFQWSMARMLAPGQYATMFSLLALLAVLSVPAQVLRLVSTRVSGAVFATLGPVRLVPVGARALIVAAAAAAVLWSLLAVSSGPIASFLNTTDIVAVVWLGGAAATSLVLPIARGVLTGASAFVSLGSLNVVVGTLRVGYGLLLVGLGAGAAGAIAATPMSGLTGIVLVVLAGRWLARRQQTGPTDLSSFGRLDWSTNAKVALMGLAVAGLLNMDILVVRHFFGDSEAALYSASSLVGRIVLFASSPVAAVLLPHLMRQTARDVPTAHAISVGLGLTLAMSAIAALAVLTARDLVFSVIFGDRYPVVPALLWAYVIAGALLSVLKLLSHVHVGIGRLRLWLPLLTLAAAYTATIWARHDSPLQVIWTLNVFLCVAVALQLAATAMILMRELRQPSSRELEDRGQPAAGNRRKGRA